MEIERTSTYIIAEIGQNHNGDMEIARRLIDVAAMPIVDGFSNHALKGVDAVKFTKRDLDEELCDSIANRPYTSPHSFGHTYMEHRQALEFSNQQHAELERYARSKGLDFIETLCSPGCLSLLDTVRVDAIKIASRDVTNIPLLEKIGQTGASVILSTGMCSMEELRHAIDVIGKPPGMVSLLHCLSEYPAQYENINLRAIPYMKSLFPEHCIGYSDHSIGIVVPTAAVALGAAIIEKHITLNRSMKGSDQAGSLEPDGLRRMVRDIRNIEKALGEEKKEILEAVRETRNKLARSLASSHPIQKGARLALEDLCMLSPGDGLPWDAHKSLLGKICRKDIPAKSILNPEDFE